MLNPVGRAGPGIITPLLKANDIALAAANWSSLERALKSAGQLNGTVQLPAGPFYFENVAASAVNLDENRAFITVRGAGRDKTLLIPTGTNAFPSLSVASALVGYTKDGSFTVGDNKITGIVAADTKYVFGEVVYFWKRTTTPTNDRSVRQRLTVTGITGTTRVDFLGQTIGSGPPAPDDFKHIKGYAVDGTSTAHSPVPAGSTSVYLLDSSLAANFSVGDDVLIGDGPGINEFFGEWARVTSVSGHTVNFSPPLEQSYASDLTCLVPGRLNPRTGRRQHMTDIVFRDLSICAPASGANAGQFGVVRAGARIRFENVGFIGSPFATSAPTLHDISFATCGNLTIRDGFCDGNLAVNLVQNLTIDNVVANGLTISEFSLGCSVINATTIGTPGIEIGSGLCTGVSLVNCTVRGDAVMNIFAQDARIENLTAPQLNLLEGSTGILTTPLAPDPTQVVDGTTEGNWLEPLQRQVLNRKVVSDADSHVTLELEARSGQTAALQEWQDSSGTPVASLAISSSGTVNGADLFAGSGMDMRIGTPDDGGLFQAFSNSSPYYPGQTYIECGNASGAAIILRTANGGATRLSIVNGGDAVFQPPSSAGKGLIIRGLSSQSVDLQQWQNDSTTTLFAIRADGHLATANSESSAPPSTTPHRLKIYDTGGALIGYIPIYPSA